MLIVLSDQFRMFLFYEYNWTVIIMLSSCVILIGYSYGFSSQYKNFNSGYIKS